LFEVLAPEAGHDRAEVIGGELPVPAEVPEEQPTREHAVRRDADAQLPGLRDYLATTPVEYLRQVRLARTHDDLAATQPGDGTSVTAIAYRWGIRAPRSVRRLLQHRYGELPSQHCAGSDAGASPSPPAINETRAAVGRSTRTSLAITSGRPVVLPAIAVDGKAVKNAVGVDGGIPYLLAAATHGQSVVIAERQIGAKTNEVPSSHRCCAVCPSRWVGAYSPWTPPTPSARTPR
jgi:Helix-turn-helix domain